MEKTVPIFASLFFLLSLFISSTIITAADDANHLDPLSSIKTQEEQKELVPSMVALYSERQQAAAVLRKHMTSFTLLKNRANEARLQTEELYRAAARADKEYRDLTAKCLNQKAIIEPLIQEYETLSNFSKANEKDRISLVLTAHRRELAELQNKNNDRPKPLAWQRAQNVLIHMHKRHLVNSARATLESFGQTHIAKQKKIALDHAAQQAAAAPKPGLLSKLLGYQ
ncbi:MAG TPA: hypothetical protein VGT41_05385 [Candidatus Babeliales bacterium]|nr:hypothetical protein [Candidatus Babeliales bacterium]